MYGQRFQRFSPVKEGDEIDVKIEAIGEKGDGIAKKDGFVLVIPNTNKDDEVRIRVTKVLRRVGFAEVISKSEGLPKKSPAKIKSAEPEQEEEVQEESQSEGEEYSDSTEETEDFQDSEEFSEDTEEFGEETEE